MAVTHLIGHDAHNPNEHFIFATKFTSQAFNLGLPSEVPLIGFHSVFTAGFSREVLFFCEFVQAALIQLQFYCTVVSKNVLKSHCLIFQKSEIQLALNLEQYCDS